MFYAIRALTVLFSDIKKLSVAGIKIPAGLLINRVLSFAPLDSEIKAMENGTYSTVMVSQL